MKAGFAVLLVGVSPAPQGTNGLAPEAYVATLKVTRP